MAACAAIHAGCSESAPEAQAYAYTTQGRVTMLPGGGPANTLRIWHEDIPSFVGQDGSVVGMNSHDMGFPSVDEGIDLSAIEVGDPVRFRFEVTWGPSTSLEVTMIEELPADTTFAFEQPPAETESSDDPG
ncbi:MAG: hypothetical protein AAFX79_06010 [Planctomycetota bacterium]